MLERLFKYLNSCLSFATFLLLSMGMTSSIVLAQTQSQRQHDYLGVAPRHCDEILMESAVEGRIQTYLKAALERQGVSLRETLGEHLEPHLLDPGRLTIFCKARKISVSMRSLSGGLRVRVALEGKTKKGKIRGYFWAKIKIYRQIWMTRSAFNKHQGILRGELRQSIQEVDLRRPLWRENTTPARAVRSIPAGKILYLDLTEKLPDIVQGQEIQVRYQADGIEVVAAGKAVSDSRADGRVEVLVLGASHSIIARATASGGLEYVSDSF